MGHMDSPSARNRVIAANLALVLAQAIVVALIASLFAITLSWIPRGQVIDARAYLRSCVNR
jgi:hypothetical protein